MLPENSNIILAAARMRAKCSNKTPSLAVSQQRWLGPSYEQKKVYDTLGRPMVSNKYREVFRSRETRLSSARFKADETVH